MNYYNEFDPFAAAWLRELIKKGLIPDGYVDERSIIDVRPDELRDFTQCHFFAGIGGWAYGLKLAGWSEDRPVWTGSCPCQPFSSAGNQKGKADERHLWPVWFNLIRECRPPTIFGEQVSTAITHGWLDDVCQGLESEGYACGSAVLPACSVGAPHKRDRLFFVGDTKLHGSHEGAVIESIGESKEESWLFQSERPDSSCDVANTQCEQAHEEQFRPSDNEREWAPDVSSRCGLDNEQSNVADSHDQRPQGHGGFIQQHDQAGRKEPSGLPSKISVWDGEWIACPDGKQRLIEPNIPLLAHGVPNRVGKLRGYGNAIVPQVAAKFIEAFMSHAKNA